MEFELEEKLGELGLKITGNQDGDVFKLGGLQKTLELNEISHGHTACAPTTVFIPLKALKEQE